MQDSHLRADLERCEQRIRTFSQDVLDGWLGMAQEFHKAKQMLSRKGSESVRVGIGQWGQWVQRFQGVVSQSTADNLARIGALEADELQTLSSTIFAKSGGISGIAAYIAAPEAVQEEVRRWRVAARGWEPVGAGAGGD
jgi:hypothetical protein